MICNPIEGSRYMEIETTKCFTLYELSRGLAHFEGRQYNFFFNFKRDSDLAPLSQNWNGLNLSKY